MASNIVATVGGSDSNSYVTSTEADTYFGDRLGASAWTSASTAEKAQALIQATIHIDMQKFLGKKRYDLPQGNTNYQKLQWPRVFPVSVAELPWDYQLDGKFPAGHWSIDSSGNPIIPDEVKRAQMEQAFSLLKNPVGETDRNALRAQGVSSFSVGGYSEVLTRANPGILCYEARILLQPFLEKGGQLARA